MNGQLTTREYQRQVRGLFAVLRTLVRQTKEGRASVDDYAAHLEGRVGALARVHEVLMRAPEEGVDLYELVVGEFISQTVSENRFHIDGPEVRVASDIAVRLALAFHELTMNALAHGALACPAGQLEITWTMDGRTAPSWLHLSWKELGGQPLKGLPLASGFGRELLERMLPEELNVRTTIDVLPAGVHVQLQIPSPQRSPIDVTLP